MIKFDDTYVSRSVNKLKSLLRFLHSMYNSQKLLQELVHIEFLGGLFYVLLKFCSFEGYLSGNMIMPTNQQHSNTMEIKNLIQNETMQT